MSEATGERLILTLDTRGDAQPFVALPTGLANAGHEAVLAAPHRFEGFVWDQGVPFAGIDDCWSVAAQGPAAAAGILVPNGQVVVGQHVAESCAGAARDQPTRAATAADWPDAATVTGCWFLADTEREQSPLPAHDDHRADVAPRPPGCVHARGCGVTAGEDALRPAARGGVRWLNGGVPATTVAEWAGHSVEILLRIYAECLDGGDALIRQRVQMALGYAAAEVTTAARSSP
jgi:hypothetical protein